MSRWVLLFAFISFFSLSSQSQELKDRLSISFNDLPLELVLDSISFKTGYQFSYNADILPRGSLFELSKTNIHIDTLMKTLLVGTGIYFEKIDDLIILRSSTKNSSHQKPVTFLSGWVRDFKTREPIEGVNVHLNGTMIGTSTDQYGNYEIKNIPVGSYLLVFSHVGYELVTHSLTVEENTAQAVNALLNVRVQQLGALELVSTPFVSDKDWPRFYREFTREFLGTSTNALKCEILNPDVLDFAFDAGENIFTASANEPLVIQNHGLGYQLTYQLQTFEKSKISTSFYGMARFENMTPPSNRIKRKWKKNRVKSFQGSINHFFKALINDNYNSAGFRVYKIDSPGEIKSNNLEYLNPRTIIKKAEKTYEWLLEFDGMIMVQFDKEVESSQYLLDGRNDRLAEEGLTGSYLLRSKPGPQHSILELKKDTVTLDKYGQIKEPFGVRTMGYWAWERVGDMMPAEYNPRTDNL